MRVTGRWDDDFRLLLYPARDDSPFGYELSDELWDEYTKAVATLNDVEKAIESEISSRYPYSPI